MEESERKRLLEEAVRAAVAEREQTPAEARMAAKAAAAGRQTGLVVLLLVVWGVLAWVWIARPEWAFGPGPRQAPSPAAEEAEVRYALYLMRGRVEQFRRTQGHLPASLANVGRVERGVTLHPTLGGYVLEGRRGATLLTLGSGMNADSFLGNALDVLERARRR